MNGARKYGRYEKSWWTSYPVMFNTKVFAVQDGQMAQTASQTDEYNSLHD